jgi:U3 small nucleolar RNA-associated protein 12
VSKGGAFMVSGSHDRSIRIWDQTQEQVFLEEEREKELEDAFEADLDQESVPEGVGVDTSAKATTTTSANLKDAERLAEAIDLCEASEHDAKLYQESKGKCKQRGEKPPPPPPINPFLLGLTGPKCVTRPPAAQRHSFHRRSVLSCFVLSCLSTVRETMMI